MPFKLSIFGRHDWVAQVAAVACLSGAMSYAVAALNFRSPLNIIWMLLLPLALGVLLNSDAQRQSLMAVVLVIASGAGMVLADYFFGTY